MTLNWIIKMLQIEEERYPRVCLRKQLYTRSHKGGAKYNWLNQVQDLFFDPIGERDYLTAFDAQTSISKKKCLIEKYEKHLRDLNLKSSHSSSSLLLFADLSIQKGPQKHLKVIIEPKFFKYIAQVRLLNLHNQRLIIIDNVIIKLVDFGFCHLCICNNYLLHKLIKCKRYDNKRNN